MATKGDAAVAKGTGTFQSPLTGAVISAESSLGSREVSDDPMENIKAIRSGLPGSSVNAVSELLRVSKAEIYALLHITPRTAQRVTRSERLDVEKSDHLVQLMKIHRRCLQVFQDDEKAMRWLKTPVFALGDQTPLSLLDTTEGIELVADTLSRIEYGVFG